MFLVARFVIGLGVPISVTGACEMTAELSHPNHRGVITGDYCSAGTPTRRFSANAARSRITQQLLVRRIHHSRRCYAGHVQHRFPMVVAHTVASSVFAVSPAADLYLVSWRRSDLNERRGAMRTAITGFLGTPSISAGPANSGSRRVMLSSLTIRAVTELTHAGGSHDHSAPVHARPQVPSIALGAIFFASPFTLALAHMTSIRHLQLSQIIDMPNKSIPVCLYPAMQLEGISPFLPRSLVSVA